MAYNKEAIFEQAKQVTKEKNLVFVEEIVSFLPIGKTAFYDFFPPESDKLNELKEIIEENKVGMKAGLRGKWYTDGNATTEIALYKLLGTDEEAHRLNGSKQVTENTTKITERKVVSEYNIEELTIEELEELERIQQRAIDIRDKCKISNA